MSRREIEQVELEIEMIVEIPQGSRNKYEMDHKTGAIWLDRTLFTATQYPLDYGFFPNTLGEDGDPLDALVWLSQPTFPGCHVNVRPVAVFWMADEKGEDAKVLCVPATDPRFAQYSDIEDLPDHLLGEIGNFFETYKLLEPNKDTTVRNWEGREAAEKEIELSIARHRH